MLGHRFAIAAEGFLGLHCEVAAVEELRQAQEDGDRDGIAAGR